MKKPRVQAVEESVFGVYVWITPDGMLCDEQDRPLSIAAQKGDLRRIKQLQQAAAHYGFPEGRPHFMAGRTKISDEEYERQKFAQLQGELADPYDLGALIDAQRAARGR
jgi:hypothetical protein